MIVLRPARLSDLDFVARTDVLVDLEDEGAPYSETQLTALANRPDHRAKIAAFLSELDKAGWLCEDSQTGQPVGLLLCHFRDRWRDRFDEFDSDFIFTELDPGLFPANGLFCEVFQLWVQPAYRRQGLATRLKQQMEAEAVRRNVELIYTHTRARNQHVIELNRKLGYMEVRRGPIWDEAVRVSLVKRLKA